MFDSLLGGKFSNKCKDAIKRINSRVVPIGKKKQSMLRFLRKAVADLLANGHDSDAFGRIDALIVDINHMSCYDMIEQYCQYISKGLPSLQKQRECPQEAMEAVSTLIFAAARFPDLPELCDLRRAFTERYGSCMESSVHAEFVEKIQKKSFSLEKKLHLMQEIAEEYSINWDSKKFRNKISSPTGPALPTDKPKKGPFNSNEIDEPSYKLPNGRNGTVINVPHQETASRERGQSTPRKTMQKLQTDTKGIHVTSSINSGHGHDSSKKTKKVFADERENMKPFYNETALPNDVKSKDRQNGIYKDEINEDRQNGMRKDEVNEDRQNGMHKDEVTEDRKNGIHKDEVNEVFTCNRSSGAQEVQNYNGLEKQMNGSVRFLSGKASYKVPPYTKPNGNMSGTHAEEQHVDGLSHHQLSRVEGPDPVGQERRQVRPVNLNNDKAINMIPPYVIHKVSSVATPIDHIKRADPSTHDPASAGYGISNGGKDNLKGDLLVYDEKPKSRSVRKKHSKVSVFDDVDGIKNDPANETLRSRRKGDRRSIVTGDVDYIEQKIMDRLTRDPVADVDNAIDYGKLLIQTPSGRGRHKGNRQSGAMYDGDCDEEEKIMDQLLVHYSKKGMTDRASKTRTRAPPPTDHDVKASEHQVNNKRNLVPPDAVHHRALSLPSEQVSSVEVSKGLTHAASMQPDLMSPKMGRVHPRLPDYDELAARLIALRKT